MLLVTGTTLNAQSFMGAIMAIGISVANAILLDHVCGARSDCRVLPRSMRRSREAVAAFAPS